MPKNATKLLTIFNEANSDHIVICYNMCLESEIKYLFNS